ncbi:hypothetical protein GCM10011374_29140 [Kocuria dechangensis]|uniref:DUF6457 domain-containing protein n=1 Tax=Kocuria dechangensis TaxID=1176249 RepID=A0A917H0U6_9MICC|nr:DUF6457 domain-containing protein [Kocuria dechangensis]GGG63816.1 hypothetical protein GCM10011374_29140 [Kocuria dechangensis]
MPKDLSPAENETLERWIVALRDALGTPEAELPLDDVLHLTGDVAHFTVRPAVPPTAYLMGYHVGRAVAGGEDQRAALRRALDTVAALVPADRDDPEEN